MNTKNKAENMARNAYHAVPLYNRLAQQKGLDIASAGFEEFPIVTKGHYLESGMSCLSSKYIGDYIGGKLKMTRTSGSTGKFTEIYWKPEQNRRSLLSLWMYRKKYYNISAADRLCYFFSSDGGEKEYWEESNRLGISRKFIYQGDFQEAYEKMVEFNPVWMILQPSLVVLLCNIAETTGKKPGNLRYIEFTGEYLDEGVRKRTEEIFKCQTANQYGSKEVNSIAYECPEGKLHCMSDNVYLEVMDESGKMVEDAEGDICVTTLQNQAMPLVRFNIEDRGILHRKYTCSCGRRSDVLELKAGRKNDWILHRDGSRTHAYALMQIVHHVNLQIDGVIIQYQILQEDYEKFVVTLVMEEMEFFAMAARNIERGIRERAKEEVEVVVAASKELLPVERTGKLASFISKIKEETR